MTLCSSRWKKIFPAILPMFLVFPALSVADDSFTPNIRPSYNVRRLDGRIKIDGELDDSGWKGLPHASDFSEQFPDNGAMPPDRTEVMLTFDDQNFYIAFICFDPYPASIRSSWSDRDQIWTDDYVGIILDTYGDGVWAYEIFSNPLGLQGDGMQMTSAGEDIGFDLIFESRGVVTDSCYQVELALPFASIRFPDKPVQEWRATFWRTRPRESRETSSWAFIDENTSCWTCEFGTLTGIENIRPGNNIELLPSVIAFQSAEIRDPENRHSGLDNKKLDGEASLGARYSITSSLTAEATVNPDFSQVESDAAQIDVNEPFALFYPEKRPFFQEGGDLFGTWLDAVYTRSINNPLAAAKLIGRMGRTNIAYLGAYDKDSPIIIPFEERSGFVDAGESYSNIVRFKQTFGGSSTIGALLSDRHLKKDGGNTVFGMDLDLPFKGVYRFRTQGLGSYTTEPVDSSMTADIEQVDFDGGRYTAAFDGESFGGHAVFAGLSRETRRLYIGMDYLEISPTFRADNGFITKNDTRHIDFSSSLNFYPEIRIFDRIQPGIEVGRVWNSSGRYRDGWIVPFLFFQLKGQTNISLEYINTRENFRGQKLGTINRFACEISSSFSEPVQAGVEFEIGPRIARNEDPPVLGDGLDYMVWVDIKPTSRMKIEQVYEFSTLERQDNNVELFRGFIYRARVNYQFSREMFLRLILQYDDFDRNINIDPLFSYKLNPFSIFYIGSTHGYRDIDNSDHFTPTSRQFFAKFQYLFRM